VVVPIFVVERRFAEDLEASAEVADRINRINEEEGVRWVYSFLSADKRKTYCLYEAPMADAIRRAAARAGLPTDAVIELGGRMLPDGSLAGLPAGGSARLRGLTGRVQGRGLPPTAVTTPSWRPACGWQRPS